MTLIRVASRAASLKSVVPMALVLGMLSACAGTADRPPVFTEPKQVPKARPTPPPPVPPSPTTEVKQTAAELEMFLIGSPTLLNGWAQDSAARLDAALRNSCPTLMKRMDDTGLTQPLDWQPLCAAIASGESPKAALEKYTQAVRIADGQGLNTGYFEPMLDGSLTPSERYAAPLYKRPADLIEVSLGEFRDTLKGQRTAGKISGNKLVPYADRAEIENGALAGKGLELLWLADPYESFSLHIQGSGQVRLPDGQVVRVGYDGQNGHLYTGVGKLLRQRNVLAPGQATMEGILNWARANPAAGKALFNENRSYVFFKRVNGDGPNGALNFVLVPERSIAVDPLFVPLGAPVWLESRHPDPAGPALAQIPFARIMIAQDTGGAIKGANRLDVFFGSDSRARAIASGMSQRGALVLLLPQLSVQRLQDAKKLVNP
jgi:membrane-bound lytic murein transglycosylase A